MASATDNDDLVAQLQTELKRLKDENQKLRATNRRWMRIAGTNALTGLTNRAFFTTALLPNAIGQANAASQPLGCVMIAPDNIGEYNQKFGRTGGDELVKGLAQFLSENVEGDEKLVHVDGANFVLMIPQADLAKAKRRSLLLRAGALNRQFACSGTQVSLTLSLGIVSRAPPQEGADLNVKDVVEEFLRRLAAALDQAKQLGGDRPYEDPEINF